MDNVSSLARKGLTQEIVKCQQHDYSKPNKGGGIL